MGRQRRPRPASSRRFRPGASGHRAATRRLLLGVAFAAVTTLGWYLERDGRTPPDTEQAPAPHTQRPASQHAQPAPDPTRSAAPQAGPALDPTRSAAAPQAGPYTEHAGSVVHVADGDTVRFRSAAGEMRIRLDSIDAPEQDGGAQRPGQPFAQASRRHLEQWLQGRTVKARCFETDQYGRSVCDLIDADGQSAAQAQVRAGLAWAYTAAKGRYLRDASLVSLQAQAESARRGLWQNGRAVAPWVWRYDCWREQQCAP